MTFKYLAGFRVSIKSVYVRISAGNGRVAGHGRHSFYIVNRFLAFVWFFPLKFVYSPIKQYVTILFSFNFPPLTICFFWGDRAPMANGRPLSRFWFRFTAQNNLVGFYFKKMWNLSTAILREMARLFPQFRVRRHFCSIWRTVTSSLVSWQHSTTSVASIQ